MIGGSGFAVVAWGRGAPEALNTSAMGEPTGVVRALWCSAGNGGTGGVNASNNGDEYGGAPGPEDGPESVFLTIKRKKGKR